MNIIETKLSGVVILEPKVFSDQRGFFVETFRETALRAAGISEIFVQDNHSPGHQKVYCAASTIS